VVKKMNRTVEEAELVTADLMTAFRKSDDAPKDWTEAQAQMAWERYRKFLRLAARMPGGRIAPTRDIDVFWHLHMLHPVAYYRDCQRLFGRIFDHDGGFGKGEGELPVLIGVFEETDKAWREAYGEPYLREQDLPEGGATNCWHDCQGHCWHDCSGQ
jgi:hypothetical protein